MDVLNQRKGLVIAGLVLGALVASLAFFGNPANMTMCAACFIRDTAGALKLHTTATVLSSCVGELVRSRYRCARVDLQSAHDVNANAVQCHAKANGTPYNTGDGVKMIHEVGAKRRGHSGIEYGPYCCVPATEEIGCAVCSYWLSDFVMTHSTIVNGEAKRFENETHGPMTMRGVRLFRPIHYEEDLEEMAFSMDSLTYANVPMYMICSSSSKTYRSIGAPGCTTIHRCSPLFGAIRKVYRAPQ